MIRTNAFGTFNGQDVTRVDLRTSNGLSASFISLGARLTNLLLPDRDGVMSDVVLGFDDLQGYIERDACFGATCGRFGNRIRDSKFMLDGVTYLLPANEGPHHLHGGPNGFDRQVWETEIDLEEESVRFHLTSPDGDMGHPGDLEVTTTYRLLDPGILSVVMEAQTNKSGVVNLLHHSYFNLAGHNARTVLDQVLLVHADQYLPVAADNIPTGDVLDVVGTAFDFTNATRIADGLERADGALPEGYDHNFCLRHTRGKLSCAAELYDPGSGRHLMLETTEPGLQVYTAGHFPEATLGKANALYRKFSGIALESQTYPNAPNEPSFPSSVVRPRERYRHEMRFTFGVRG